MREEYTLAKIKALISEFANDASVNELSALLEIAAFANTEYNQKLLSHENKEFYVVADMIVDDNYVYQDESEILFVNEGLATKFTEVEANEMVNCMNALEARKVKVEE